MIARKIHRYTPLLLLGFALTGLWLAGPRGSKTGAKKPVVAIKDREGKPPLINGRLEGCPLCHAKMRGLSPAHDPRALGCFSCHLGDPFSLDKEQAHRDMEMVPGNLRTARLSCGAPDCHPEIVGRVDSSLMATGRGMVAVDRFVFGEQETPDGRESLADLGDSPADSHLRRLCASCHLNNPRETPGPISETTRGGGCTACHLEYDREALREYRRFYRQSFIDRLLTAAVNHLPFQSPAPPDRHPRLTLPRDNSHCFGCHSRSGRIATSYEGLYETQLRPEEAIGKKGVRVLTDGRVFKTHTPDIHQTRGLICIDCHTARDAMGDGRSHLHKEDQVEIRCEDCHFRKAPPTTFATALDPESLRLWKLRKWKHADRPLLTLRLSGRPLPQAFFARSGKPVLIDRAKGRLHPLNPPAAACDTAIRGHERLACRSCHAAWAPQCVGCHTSYDSAATGFDHLLKRPVPGLWREYRGDFLHDPPALGVRTLQSPRQGSSGTKTVRREVVDIFVPGMVLTIDTDASGETGTTASKQKRADSRIFRRLFAPLDPHTVTRRGRSCDSCHRSSQALGYGRGELEFRAEGSTGRWFFTPRYDPLPADRFSADSLPADAWIGFMSDGTPPFSTRSDARPLNREEQKRTLLVGICLYCHPDRGPRTPGIYADFRKSLQRMSSRCRLPAPER